MNSLNGHIKSIEVSGSLSLVTVVVEVDLDLRSIVIETPDTAAYLQSDHAVRVLFKETEVVIGTAVDHKVSMQNRIAGKIIGLEQGSLLSKVRIESKVGEIVSIISTNAVQNLNLLVGTEVVAMIKLNEVMLSAK